MMKKTACMALAIMQAACVFSPEGVLGVTWDMPADIAAKKMGVHCSAWVFWPDYSRYQHCENSSERTIWDHRVIVVQLAREAESGKLAGVAIWFDDCRFADLKRRMTREFSLEPGEYSEYVRGDFMDINAGRAELRGNRARCALTVHDAGYDKARQEHDMDDWTWLYH